MDRKENWGGSRPGSGRKVKAESTDKINLFDAAIKPAQIKKMLKAVLGKALKGDVKAAQLLLETRYGRPSMSLDHTSKGEKISQSPLMFVSADKLTDDQLQEYIQNSLNGVKSTSEIDHSATY